MISAGNVQEFLEEVLTEQFEIEPEEIRPDAHIYDDLGLDSIDAVDLVIKLQEETGKRLRPDEFKNARTVQDLVDTIELLIAG